MACYQHNLLPVIAAADDLTKQFGTRIPTTV
jgi:septin family protein